MDINALKFILLSLMLLIALFVGLLPLFLYREWTESTKNLGRKASITISMLSCFSGGVILSVSWLDIMPDSREFYSKVERKLNHNYNFPYVELFMAFGFFLVYLIEEIIGECFKANTREKATELTELKRSSSITQYDTIKLPKNPKDKKSLTNVFTLVFALAFHMLMEGFIFGVQTKMLSLGSLFFGIIVHKCLVIFSIGIKLARQLGDRLRLAIGLIALLAFASPTSASIGLLVQNSFVDNLAGSIFSAAVSSISVGTFMYIALFEIIIPERNAPYSKILQWLGCFMGFSVMTVIIAFAG